MEKSSRSLGWLVAVCAALAAAGVFLWGLSANRPLAELRATLAQKEGELASAKEKAEGLDQAQAKIADLETTIAQLRETSVKSGAPAEESAAASEKPSSFLTDLMKSLVPGKDGQKGDQNPMGGLLSMFKGEGGKQLAEYSAGMAVDMGYSDFFRELNLPKETEDQVRDIFKRNMAGQITEGLGMFENGLDLEKAKQFEADAKAQLRAELSTVLSADELAQWDAYEETMDVRMLKQQYEMQMSMFAPGVTPENRELVIQTLTDEMLAVKERGEASDFDIEGNLARQHEAFERTREWVAQQLDEEQYAQVDRFFTQQEDMVRAALQMFPGLIEQKPEE